MVCFVSDGRGNINSSYGRLFRKDIVKSEYSLSALIQVRFINIPNKVR